MVLQQFMWVKNRKTNRISLHVRGLVVIRIVLFALISLCLYSTEAEAQVFNRKFSNDRQKRLPKYDRQRMHFGFTLGMNNTNFRVRNVDNIQQYDSVFVIDPKGQMGFNLGIITDMRIGQHFNLRFIPDLSFVDRKLQYTLSTIDTANIQVVRTEEQKIESVFLEFPLSLKFKSVRINDGNWRVYVLGGGKFMMDLASQSKIRTGDNEVVVKLDRIDYAWEVGVGFDIYMQYFKFSPELKVSFGLNNLLVKDETVYTRTINKLNSTAFLLSFHFE